MIADRARFRAAKKLQRLVGYRVPELAFNGAFLEAVESAIEYNALDHNLQEQLSNFFHDFLSCTCKESPNCGCPERKFAHIIIELRMSGLDHRQIADHLLSEYGIELFPADILGFLEESVHVLEAISEVAEIGGEEKVAIASNSCIRDIEQ